MHKQIDSGTWGGGQKVCVCLPATSMNVDRISTRLEKYTNKNQLTYLNSYRRQVWKNNFETTINSTSMLEAGPNSQSNFKYTKARWTSAPVKTFSYVHFLSFIFCFRFVLLSMTTFCALPSKCFAAVWNGTNSIKIWVHPRPIIWLNIFNKLNVLCNPIKQKIKA